MKKRAVTTEHGFTLMEILISASIFGIALVIAVGVFTTTSSAQRRIQVLTKLQGDTRYVMDVLAQSVRLDGLDYQWYTNGRINGAYNVLLASGQELAFRYKDEIPGRVTNELVTTDTAGIRRVYRILQPSYNVEEPKSIAVCTQNTKDASQDGRCSDISYDPNMQNFLAYPNFKPITPTTINVDLFEIWISPGNDPYRAPPASVIDCRNETISHASDPQPVCPPTQPNCDTRGGYDSKLGLCTCVAGRDCINEACVPEPSLGDGMGYCARNNEQPRATIIITSRNLDTAANQQQSTTMQTTVSSRIYRR